MSSTIHNFTYRATRDVQRINQIDERKKSPSVSPCDKAYMSQSAYDLSTDDITLAPESSEIEALHKQSINDTEIAKLLDSDASSVVSVANETCISASTQYTDRDRMTADHILNDEEQLEIPLILNATENISHVSTIEENNNAIANRPFPHSMNSSVNQPQIGSWASNFEEISSQAESALLVEKSLIKINDQKSSTLEFNGYISCDMLDLKSSETINRVNLIRILLADETIDMSFDNLLSLSFEESEILESIVYDDKEDETTTPQVGLHRTLREVPIVSTVCETALPSLSDAGCEASPVSTSIEAVPATRATSSISGLHPTFMVAREFIDSLSSPSRHVDEISSYPVGMVDIRNGFSVTNDGSLDNKSCNTGSASQKSFCKKVYSTSELNNHVDLSKEIQTLSFLDTINRIKLIRILISDKNLDMSFQDLLCIGFEEFEILYSVFLD
jgi:hypothetical protein